MKIIVLHGEDEKKIYERLQKFISVAKERGWEVTHLDESDSPIQEQLSARSLFSKNRFFILRDTSRLGKKELQWLSRYYEKLDGTLIIYHEGVVGATILKSLSKESKIEEFKLPVLLWNFLDEMVPGNSVKLIKDFHKIIEREAPEFLITLISRLMRDLYWVKVDPKSVQLPPWRDQKLKNQASHYPVERLQEIISSLSEIDIKVKSSKANLTDELDLLIIKQLE
jgi:DNA polymerase III delta subunit